MKALSFIGFFLLISVSAIAQTIIERVEPPFWWTNMQNDSLQLMLYGTNLKDARVSTNYQGVKIIQTHNADSPNYLFVDMVINEGTKPGQIELVIGINNGRSSRIKYELKQRSANSKNRLGFTNKDVLYLLTPDRFANGNPANDSVSGLKEGHNRAADYGRHGGDIKGIADHLDYIKDMGFSAIWLNPILENDQPEWSYHGYATTDYYKVDPRFGSQEEYVALSKKAKSMGIGMIMDIIVNHCGSEHWWMNDLPFDDWINYNGKPYQQSNHRKTTLVDPYVAQSDRKIMTEGWFVPAMPDLNQRNQFLSKYLIQNSIWWIEYADLYGIRQDTYSYPFRQFMTDWTCAIRNEYPNINIVGEEWVENPAIIAYWQEGKVNQDGYTSCLPSLMDFPLTFSIHKALNEDEEWGKGLVRIYEMLGNDFLYADPNQLVIFPDNHDMSRIFTQIKEDKDLYKMAMGLILTLRGIPQIYYGTEILMSNPGTESHGVIRSDFPGGWEGDSINVFTGKNLDIEIKSYKNWLKDLIHWRNETPVLHHGQLMHYEPQNGVYVYFRYDNESTVMVVVNKNNESVDLPLARFKERINGYSKVRDILDKQDFILEDKLTLLKRSITILELK